MKKHISYKLALIIKENSELRTLIDFIIKEANFAGQYGNSISKVKIEIKKKDWLRLRFFDEAILEWEETLS